MYVIFKKRDLDNAQKEIAGINLELLKQNLEQEILEKINQKVKVKLIKKDDQGRLNFSIKALLNKKQKA